MESSTSSSTTHRPQTENRRRSSGRINYRIRPQRKRSRTDHEEGSSSSVLQELESPLLHENIPATTAAGGGGASAIDKKEEKDYNENPSAVVQQFEQEDLQKEQTGKRPKHSKELDDYDIEFDEEEERQLAALLEGYARAGGSGVGGVATRSLEHQRSELEQEFEISVEHEPEFNGRQLDIEQLEVPQDGHDGEGDESFGGANFDALLLQAVDGEVSYPALPRILDDGQILYETIEAGGCSGAPQIEQAKNEDPDISLTTKGLVPPEPDQELKPLATGPDGVVDPDKALQSEAKRDPNMPATETKNPLQLYRARGKERQPRLSVTDLVMNLWCEQQFHYNLLRGFRRRTPAMRTGTAIHKEIEEEVHTVVPVEIRTPEDSWGLKIYNMLQGVETLRHGGVTRELEVWGWIEGVWTIGVIDEIRFEKDGYDAFSEKLKERKRSRSRSRKKKESDTEEESEQGLKIQDESVAEKDTSEKKVEEPIEESPKPKKKRGRPRKNPLPEEDSASEGSASNASSAGSKPITPVPETPRKGKERQMSIETYFSPTKASPSKPLPPEAAPVYIVDLKTRSSDKPPSATSSQGRMTFLQLMLYHRLLSDVLHCHPKQSTDYLCEFHKLDPDAPFSDSFVAQIASLEPQASSPGGTSELSPLSLESILEHNSIEKLYGLFHERLRKTISGVHNTLTAVYRWQANGDIIGASSFEFESETLSSHVEDVMSWWKGQRDTVGVGVTDAWKCRSCEFYDECAWRKKKIEEAGEAMRKRREENTKKWNTRGGLGDIVVIKTTDRPRGFFGRAPEKKEEDTGAGEVKEHTASEETNEKNDTSNEMTS